MKMRLLVILLLILLIIFAIADCEQQIESERRTFDKLKKLKKKSIIAKIKSKIAKKLLKKSAKKSKKSKVKVIPAEVIYGEMVELQHGHHSSIADQSHLPFLIY